jgi:glycosyltransferase involved in cell wall biosynthesis
MDRRRVILTILDCGMMKRKKGIAKKFVQWFYLSLPVSRAHIVTAISEETKKEIIHYTGCSPNKIEVIPVAVSSIYKPCPKKFNEEKPVILQIGTGPNKNLLRLIKALEGLNCHLTIVGKLSAEQLEALKTHNVDFSNEYNITNERLLEKYKECDILTFVSTFEGFGMPIVEANSVERVVITSNISSMPEVAGKAAHLVDPFSVEEIRTGFLYIVRNRSYREKLLKEGRVNKLRYDGNKIASMYYNLYLSLVN